jgi:hypothetical protein
MNEFILVDKFCKIQIDQTCKKFILFESNFFSICIVNSIYIKWTSLIITSNKESDSYLNELYRGIPNGDAILKICMINKNEFADFIEIFVKYFF